MLAGQFEGWYVLILHCLKPWISARHLQRGAREPGAPPSVPPWKMRRSLLSAEKSAFLSLLPLLLNRPLSAPPPPKCADLVANVLANLHCHLTTWPPSPPCPPPPPGSPGTSTPPSQPSSLWQAKTWAASGTSSPPPSTPRSGATMSTASPP